VFAAASHDLKLTAAPSAAYRNIVPQYPQIKCVPSGVSLRPAPRVLRSARNNVLKPRWPAEPSDGRTAAHTGAGCSRPRRRVAVEPARRMASSSEAAVQRSREHDSSEAQRVADLERWAGELREGGGAEGACHA
jgi:hypothetical protein